MEKKIAKKHNASNKGLFVALGVAVAVLVIVVAGVLLFFQSPERQLANGFANLVTASSFQVDGTVYAKSQAGHYETTISAKTNKKVLSSAVKFQFDGTAGSKLTGDVQAIIADDGVLYAKLDKPQKFMESFADSFVASMLGGASGSTLTPEQQTLALAPVRAGLSEAGVKMEGKWVKISQSEFRTLTGGTETGTDCYVDFSRTLESDSSARNDLAAAYKKHRFIKINDKLEAEGTAQGYRVAIDQAKLKEFKDDVADNAAVKKLGSCGQDILTFGATDNLNDQSVDIWVDRFSHTITRVKYDKTEGDSTSNVDLKFKYDVDVSVSSPSETVRLDEVLPAFATPTE